MLFVELWIPLSTHMEGAFLYPHFIAVSRKAFSSTGNGGIGSCDSVAPLRSETGGFCMRFPILGLCRPATSGLAQMLHSLGADMGSPFFACDEVGRPRDFYEPSDLSP